MSQMMKPDSVPLKDPPNWRYLVLEFVCSLHFHIPDDDDDDDAMEENLLCG